MNNNNPHQQLLVVPSIEESHGVNATSYTMFNENNARQDMFTSVPINQPPLPQPDLSHTGVTIQTQPNQSRFYNYEQSNQGVARRNLAFMGAVAYKHPEFVAELDKEELVGTYSTTTFKMENLFQMLIRIFYYCSCLTPSISHTLMITNKRCIAVVHEVQSDVKFQSKVSKEFVKNLTSVDLHNHSEPYPLYRIFPHAVLWFRIINIIPLLLIFTSLWLSFSSLFVFASVTLVAMFSEAIEIGSVIGLLIYNRGNIDRKEVSTFRLVVYLVFMILSVIVGFFMMLSGFIAGGLSPLSQPELGIPFFIFNNLTMLFLIIAFLAYPVYPHQHKTELKLVYYETVHGRTQVVLLEPLLAEEAQLALLTLRKDIQVITSSSNSNSSSSKME